MKPWQVHELARTGADIGTIQRIAERNGVPLDEAQLYDIAARCQPSIDQKSAKVPNEIKRRKIRRKKIK